jgi:hypothetical protein
LLEAPFCLVPRLVLGKALFHLEFRFSLFGKLNN